MPKAMEEALRKTAVRKAKKGELRKKKGESSKKAIARYMYGTMQKRGVM